MPPSAAWTDEHDVTLLRALIAQTLQTRKTLYATPGLGDVAGNGGSRINQRVLLMLKKKVLAMGKEGAMVEEEVRRVSGPRTPRKKKEEVKEGKVKKDEDEEKVKVSASHPHASPKAVKTEPPEDPFAAFAVQTPRKHKLTPDERAAKRIKYEGV